MIRAFLMNMEDKDLYFSFFTKGKLKTSENTRSVIRYLSFNKEFRKEIQKIRHEFGIAVKAFFEPSKSLTAFNKKYKNWDIKTKSKFYSKVKSLAGKFNLPKGWLLTLRYLIGSAFLIEPLPDVIVGKFPEDTQEIKENYIALLIGTNYSQEEVVSIVRKKWKEIKPLLADLPKQPKIILHKDTVYLADYILYLRDKDKKSFPYIADKIESISSEHPEWFGNKIITLSDSEVRQIYYRQKEKINKIIVTKSPK